MMTLLEKPTYEPEAARRAAFDRLVALLIGKGMEMQTGATPLADAASETSLGLLSRLRAARAVYALSSNGELVRETEGAWTLRHAIV